MRKPKIDMNNVRNLYWDEKLSIRQIANKLGASFGFIRTEMVRLGIPRRLLNRREVVKPLKEKLEDLYINQALTIDKVAKSLDVSPTTIFKWIKEYKIPIRRFKYNKYNFSEDPREKAYILGISTGDFHVCRQNKLINVELTTTHPAMVELFYSIFQKYANVKKYSKYNKRTERYEWKAWTLLNNSFEFMLKKEFDIDNDYFYDFFAGFFDAEGTLHIYNNHGFIGLSLLIYNSNEKLLKIFKNRLEKDGFHPKFSLFSKKGTKNSDNYYQVVDLFAIRLHTNKEVLDLLDKMPIKHMEKIEKMKIAFSINRFNKWSEIEEQVNLLRNKIKKEVQEFINPLNFQKNERSSILQEVKK